MEHRTKIGITVGPACEGKILEMMVKEGLDFVRLNFSHGTYQKHSELIKQIRQLEKKTNRYIGIIQDLQGPKIRLGELPEKGIQVSKKENIIFNTAIHRYKKNEIPITYRGLEKVLHPGEKILIDDGRIEVTIKQVRATQIRAEVEEGGVLTSHKGLNFPDTRFSVPALSIKDKQDILFGIKKGVDSIALSFVKRAADIIELRSYLNKDKKKSNIIPAIIAKIERPEAIENLEEIVSVSDGIMVARGDLGLETPGEELPILQKRIIETTRHHHKPVMVATQLLDSMRENKRPTRAEVSDVANAVIDHADGLLLTNETAVGKFPVLTVKTLKNIIVATEQSHYDDIVQAPLNQQINNSLERLLVELSQLLSTERGKIKALVTYSKDGELARFVSYAHPEVPLVIGVPTPLLARRLSIIWGIQTFVCRSTKLEKWVAASFKYLKMNKLAKKDESIVVVVVKQSTSEDKIIFETKKLN